MSEVSFIPIHGHRLWTATMPRLTTFGFWPVLAPEACPDVPGYSQDSVFPPEHPERTFQANLVPHVAAADFG